MSGLQAPGAVAPDQGDRLRALGLGLLVSVIWASSFVIIKVGLGYIGPLSMGGFRYFCAFLILLPLMLRPGHATTWRLPWHLWLQLTLVGVTAYPIANGLLYWGLTRITPTSSSFLFNMTPFLVLALGIIALRELPSPGQWAGMTLVAAGIVIFFALPLGQGEIIGVIATGVAALAFAWYVVQARALARTGQLSAVMLTALPLGIGGALHLAISLLVEGLPRWDPRALLVVLWLAAFNTALANTAWTKALASLKAFELSVLMNVMPVETALIAWLALGEDFPPLKVLGIALVIPGVLLVHWATGRRSLAAQRSLRTNPSK